MADNADDLTSASPHGGPRGRAAEVLRDMIAIGVLRPGQQLHRGDLAARTGLPPTAVMAALRQLSAEGVLDRRPDHGHYVASLSSEQLRQICLLRDTIENRLAATLDWPDQDRIDELRQLNQRLMTADATKTRAFIEADHDFHQALWNLSSELILVGEIARMWRQIEPYRTFMFYDPPVPRRLHSDHQAIVDALEQRDRIAYLHAVQAHQRRTYPTVERLARREASEAS